MSQNTFCSVAPYLKVKNGQLEAFKQLFSAMKTKTMTEPGALFYELTVSGDTVHFREAYVDAEAVMYHLINIDSLLQKSFELADLERIEIHGPAEEIDKLRGPLANLEPDFFVYDSGFVREDEG